MSSYRKLRETSMFNIVSIKQYMNDNKSKADDADTGNAPLPRYKVTKRPAAITDNPMVKVLDSIVSGLEGSLGKRT